MKGSDESWILSVSSMMVLLLGGFCDAENCDQLAFIICSLADINKMDKRC
jgi:hypothetical protein